MQAVQALCPDCPLWSILGEHAPEMIERVRVHPYSLEDSKQVGTLACAREVIAALKHQRPERCAELRQVLPEPEHDTSHIHHLTQCPEIELVAQLVESNPGLATQIV